MAKLILGVTGSVAAIRTPAIYQQLTAAGHSVRLVATEAALYFFEAGALEAAGSSDPSRSGPVFRDSDEWPNPRYARDDEVLHISFRDWADMLIIAPLDANTLAKLALGISDNLLTCVYRAWDFSKPVILAPAMNTLMWYNPPTLRHLRQVLEDRAPASVPHDWSLDEAADVFAANAPGIILVPPQAKRLACGDVGMGAMAEVSRIAETVRKTLADEPSVAIGE